MTRGLTQTRNDLDERLRTVVVTGIFSHSTVGEAFTVQHGLGTTPSMVAALPLTDARVWAEEADERVWNATKVVLRCNVADAPLRLLIVE